jgi:lipopolysaccharide export system protein LptA
MRRALGLAFAAWAALACAQGFSFSAKSMSGSMAQGGERTVLSGAARVVSDNLVISADRIELYGKDFRYASCSGSVQARDSQRGLFVSSPDLFYDRELKLMRSRGPTVIEDRKNKIVISGDYVESDEARDSTIIQVGVRIVKEDMICRAEFALFRRKENILELSGLPVVVWKGDEYRASRISVNTETNEIKMEGSVSGSLSMQAGPSPSPSPGAAPLPATAGPVPSPSPSPGAAPSPTTAGPVPSPGPGGL